MICKKEIDRAADHAGNLAACLLISISFIDQIMRDIENPHSANLNALKHLLEVSLRLADPIADVMGEMSDALFPLNVEGHHA